MEKARDELLSQLAAYRKGREHDITVVFDGYRNGMATQQVSYKEDITVIYTRLGEKADDVIKKMISREHREWLVVTADRDIVYHAWSAGSVPVEPDKFMGIISRACSAGTEEVPAVSENGEDEDDLDEGRDRRGNPYRPSKKMKALRRALSKL
jgi:predicted RNA-binding protein with PIN domain